MSGLVRDVHEEGGDLALVVGLRATQAKPGNTPACVEACDLAPAPRVGLDAIEERLGDDARHGHIGITATAPRRRPSVGPRLAAGIAVSASRAAVAVLAAAKARSVATVMRGHRDGAGEECQPSQECQDHPRCW